MTYAGNRLINANNITPIIFVLIVVFLNHSKPDNLLPYFVVLVGIFFTAAEAFYFEITTNELIVKNYIIPFLNIRYELNEITLVQFLETNRRSTSKARVKIIRGDKRSLPISAASLRIKDWQLFINELSAKKIQVDIQAISLKSAIGIPED